MSWARAEGQGLIVLQREATSRAKWVAVSRFVTHSIVSGLRVNSETRHCLERIEPKKGEERKFYKER